MKSNLIFISLILCFNILFDLKAEENQKIVSYEALYKITSDDYKISGFLRLMGKNDQSLYDLQLNGIQHFFTVTSDSNSYSYSPSNGYKVGWSENNFFSPVYLEKRLKSPEAIFKDSLKRIHPFTLKVENGAVTEVTYNQLTFKVSENKEFNGIKIPSILKFHNLTFTLEVFKPNIEIDDKAFKVTNKN